METNKEFIPPEEAMVLKELGFDEPCLAMYRKDRLYLLQEPKTVNSEKESVISAPLYQQAFKWFRDTHNLKHDIPDHVGTKFYYEFYDTTNQISKFAIKMFITKDKNWDNIEFETYEEGELMCLKKMIEFIKSGNYENKNL